MSTTAEPAPPVSRFVRLLVADIGPQGAAGEVLVVPASSKEEGRMTYDQTAQSRWFGFGPKTAQKGLTELQNAGLLTRRTVVAAAPLSPTGKTVECWYSLTGDYFREARAELQRRTAREVLRRQRRGRSPSTSGRNRQRDPAKGKDR